MQFFYSVFFSIYLKYFEARELKTDYFKINDVFKPLTYRQKFEIAKLDVIKTSEEAKLKGIKYQTLTNISPVGIFHARSDGYTTFVNPKWCEISGLSKNEALGNGWLKAVHPDDIEQVKIEWEQATAQKRSSETQYRFLLNDGSTKWVLGRAVPEINHHNQIIGHIGTITDITKIKLYQQEQIVLKEKAEESDRLKSAFLCNMSHEIRTPMNGILGFAGLLKEPHLTDEEQQSYIQIIEKSGARMLNIINDIVAISKIESGAIDIHLTETNINSQFQFVYDLLKLDAANKELELFFYSTLPEREAVINTDSEKFCSIITNLVKNAIKYTDKGTIEFGYVKKGEKFEFYVKDTGIGIPKEKHEAIFERFIQADITDRMARQGAGLGLAISKAYVEMLGGKIWVASEEGKGSTFFFTIPCNTNSKVESDILTDKIPEDETKPIIPEISGLKVLIAEDDAPSRKYLSLLLIDFCKEILEAETGNKTIEICRNNPDINLILMDIQMPDINGYEATRQIRAFNKDVIIIAQTAFAFAVDREKSIAAGCNDYISKPINRTKLENLLQKYFEC